jgi:hypothetical protein
MSLNMTNAMDQKKIRRFGKLFGTIDFDIKENINPDVIKQKRSDTIVGKFHIAGKSFEVTLAELDRIIETAETAKSSFQKSYSMGRFGY